MTCGTKGGTAGLRGEEHDHLLIRHSGSFLHRALSQLSSRGARAVCPRRPPALRHRSGAQPHRGSRAGPCPLTGDVVVDLPMRAASAALSRFRATSLLGPAVIVAGRDPPPRSDDRGPPSILREPFRRPPPPRMRRVIPDGHVTKPKRFSTRLTKPRESGVRAVDRASTCASASWLLRVGRRADDRNNGAMPRIRPPV